MGGSPKIPAITTPPPPPTPAQISLPATSPKTPNLGNTYLTGGMPGSPTTSGKKTLFGQ